MIDDKTEISKVQTFKNGTQHLRVEDKTTGKFIRYEKQICDDPEMYFGKYKGMKFSEIYEQNEGYFEWILTQDWVKDNLRNTVVDWIETH